jgi:hypothetical protein
MTWQMVQTVWKLFTGQLSWREAGANILVTIGEGILSMVTWPFRLVWKAFELVRQLLPFSDAQAGPFANLTASGMAILTTIGKGILSVAGLPLQLLSGVFTNALSGAANIWSGLTSLVSGGFQAATSVASSLGTAYVEAVRANFQMAVDIAGTVWSGVTGAVSKGWDAAKSVVSSAWQTLSGWGDSAFNFILGANPQPAPASPFGPSASQVKPSPFQRRIWCLPTGRSRARPAPLNRLHPATTATANSSPRAPSGSARAFGTLFNTVCLVKGVNAKFFDLFDLQLEPERAEVDVVLWEDVESSVAPEAVRR